MNSLILPLFALAIAAVAGYQTGAPEEVCDDMTPQHGVDPQKSTFPYTITTSKKGVKPGEKVDIVIGGGNFKGFLLQVRKNDKAVGSFDISNADKNAKTINCHGSSKSAATHKHPEDKNNLKVTWVAPEKLSGTVTLYATVAKDGGEYWVQQKISDIKIN